MMAEKEMTPKSQREEDTVKQKEINNVFFKKKEKKKKRLLRRRVFKLKLLVEVSFLQTSVPLQRRSDIYTS